MTLENHRFGNDKDDVFESVDGWLQVLTRRLINEECIFETRPRRELVLFPRAANKYKPLPSGHGAKALVAKLVAVTESFDAVVFMTDADTPG